MPTALESIWNLDIMNPRQAALGKLKLESFLGGIMVLLMKPNNNLATTFRSLFSIGASTPIH